MPTSFVRLSAGREEMRRRDAGAVLPCRRQPMFYGDKLLTTGNPDVDRDEALFGARPAPDLIAHGGIKRARRPRRALLTRGRSGATFPALPGVMTIRHSLPCEIDRRMLERLDYVRIEPQRILDLGCATGPADGAVRALSRCAAGRCRFRRTWMLAGGRTAEVHAVAAATLPQAAIGQFARWRRRGSRLLRSASVGLVWVKPAPALPERATPGAARGLPRLKPAAC